MADKPWKRVEREKCRALGGERSGPTGRDTPDCDEKVHVGLEIKYVKSYTFLTKYWEQAVENAAKVGKPPVLNVKETGRNGRDCVQMHVLYFAQLAGLADLGHGAWCQRVGDLVRIPWSTFVRLYNAAYNNNEEKSVG